MKQFILIAIFACLSGCATVVPISSNVSNDVIQNIRTNSSYRAELIYIPKFTEDIYKPYRQNKTELIDGHPGYVIPENTVLKNMLTEYLTNKFGVEKTLRISINIDIEDFYIEIYSNESVGKQVLTGMFGGELPYNIGATIIANVKTVSPAREQSKIIIAKAEDIHISGFGTHTETSQLYRGGNSLQVKMGSVINTANNKFIIYLNKFLEESGY